MADQTLRDVATDGETERLFRGDWNEEGFSTGGPRRSWRLEPHRVF